VRLYCSCAVTDRDSILIIHMSMNFILMILLDYKSKIEFNNCNNVSNITLN